MMMMTSSINISIEKERISLYPSHINCLLFVAPFNSIIMIIEWMIFSSTLSYEFFCSFESKQSANETNEQQKSLKKLFSTIRHMYGMLLDFSTFLHTDNNDDDDDYDHRFFSSSSSSS